MLEITEYSIADKLLTKLSGRLDGVNSDDINKYIASILDKGRRNVIFDFSDVSFLSSAGLRVLLINQKKMTAAGGEIAIFKITSNIREVFRLSGFLKIFRIIENEDEFEDKSDSNHSVDLSSIELENLSLEILKAGDFKGKVEAIGTSDKIELSAYQESDSVIINAKDAEYFFGFAAIGDDWNNNCNYFGESVIINNSLFVYPAVKRPAVDFMIYSDEMTDTKYSVLNGFKFSGEPASYVSFRIKDEFVEITTLLDSIAEALKTTSFAFTIIAESKGLRGMNLKQVPIVENKPQNGKSIFENDNFSEWVNFPVDKDDFNSIVAGVGYYANSPNKYENIKILPSESKFHLHCGIFDKNLLNFKTDTYQNDLSVVINELEAKKVRHILSGSVFSMGTLSIILMEE